MLKRMVNFLNQALLQDRGVVSEMFLEIQVPADEETINHPTIQVTMDDQLRLIGLLNGLLIDDNKCLRMVLDDDGRTIDCFEIGRYR